LISRIALNIKIDALSAQNQQTSTLKAGYFLKSSLSFTAKVAEMQRTQSFLSALCTFVTSAFIPHHLSVPRQHNLPPSPHEPPTG